MKRRSASYISLAFFVFFFAVGLVLFPEKSKISAESALSLCAKTIVPSLFPFFVVSKLFTSMRISDILCKIFKKAMPFLFSVNGNLASAFIIGLCGGYPIGAATVAELYDKKLCTKREAERALAFCNNTGPAFIIGAIGIGAFSDVKAGIFLFLAHILSAFAVGIIFRIFRPLNENATKAKEASRQIPNFSFAFTDAIFSSTQAILSICAYVVFFAVLISILNETKLLCFLSHLLRMIFKISDAQASALLSGTLEMTTGINALVKSSNFTIVFALSSALLSFGGLSIHAQTLNCVSKYGFDTREYFIGKLMQAFFSAGFAFLLSQLVNIAPSIESTFSPIGNTRFFFPIFPFSLAFLVIIYIFCKKGWKKEKN